MILTEQEIKKACHKAVELGYKILPSYFFTIQGWFNPSTDCCCPLTACAVMKRVVPKLDWHAGDVANAIGISALDVDNFVFGFEKYPGKLPSDRKTSLYYKMGVSIREWYDAGMQKE